MVGCEEDSGIPRHPARKGLERRVQLLQPRRPCLRLAALRMTRHVELRDVAVHDPRATRAHELDRRAHAIGDRGLGDEARSPQNSIGEPCVAVPFGTDHDGIDAGRGGRLEHGRVRLPDLRSHPVVPPGELVDDPIAGAVHRRVAHEPVGARLETGRERGERGRGRRREARVDRAALAGGRGQQATRVTRPSPQGGHPETVDEDDGGAARGGQREAVLVASDRRQRTGQHVPE